MLPACPQTRNCNPECAVCVGQLGAFGLALHNGQLLSQGEVFQGKLTLRHGPIRNLDMPGMTMVFTVADRAMLDTVKAGDKVKFRATNEGGRYTVVEIVPAP